MTKDELKDQEQDMRLGQLEADVTAIKGVTHGSDVHNWNGIVSEHNKLAGDINSIKNSSALIAKIMAGLTGLATLGGTIYGIVKAVQ